MYPLIRAFFIAASLPVYFSIFASMRIGLIILCILLTAGAFSQQRSDKQLSPPRLIRFYPNPATDYIQFDIPSQLSKESIVQIYNFLGKKVLDLPCSQLKARIDLTSLARGIYIFQLKDKTGRIIESGKFQIEK